MTIPNHKAVSSAHLGRLADCIAIAQSIQLEEQAPSVWSVDEHSVDKEIEVTELLLAIGSNDQADYHLAQAREQLARLGKMVISEPLVNPDFTATPDTPKPDYTNQCVYIDLNKVLSFLELSEYLGAIEVRCQRQRPPDTALVADGSKHKNHPSAAALAVPAIKLVSLDIDILGFKRQADGQWRLIQRRLPLKQHERIGLQQLLHSPRLLLSEPGARS